MEEWMKQPVSHLKRLVKGRAGRVAELQMEIKILEGIIDRKVREGDLGGSQKPAGKPVPSEKKGSEKQAPESAAKNAPEPEEAAPEKEPEQTKISEKSSSHAFREID